jgi:hypothetical protein
MRDVDLRHALLCLAFSRIDLLPYVHPNTTILCVLVHSTMALKNNAHIV